MDDNIKDMEQKNLIIDGVKWLVTGQGNYRDAEPLCPIHYLRLSLERNGTNSCYLKCEDCQDSYYIKREFNTEKQYIFDRIDSGPFKKLKFINLDDEAVPMAESKDKSEDDKYFVIAKLVKSKVGLRMVVYAGKQGDPDKTQIFVEPDIKRLGFDQNNIHPSDIFIKLEGTFKDSTKFSLEKDLEK